MGLRMNTNYFPVQNYVTRFHNWNGECYCAVRTEPLDVTEIGVSLQNFKGSGNIIISNSFFWFALFSKHFIYPYCTSVFKGFILIFSCEYIFNNSGLIAYRSHIPVWSTRVKFVTVCLHDKRAVLMKLIFSITENVTIVELYVETRSFKWARKKSRKGR